jgi:hypothetical protein
VETSQSSLRFCRRRALALYYQEIRSDACSLVPRVSLIELPSYGRVSTCTTRIHMHMNRIVIYIYICLCVCVCVRIDDRRRNDNRVMIGG